MKLASNLLSSWWWEALLIVLLVLTAILGNALSPYFLTPFNLALMVESMMEIAIMALPMTLIIIVGEIDLSVASTLGLASVIMGITWSAGIPLWLDIVIALAVGAVAGLFNGLLVTRLGLPSLVVTLGTLALYRGLAYVILGSQAVSNFPGSYTTFGIGYIPGTLIPWTLLLFIFLALLCVVVLHRSWIGRQLYAIGNNKEAARFAGIWVNRLKLLLFVLSGLLSALAGVVFTARISSARADNALGFELLVITVVLLGGINIFGGRGTLIGVILALFVVGGLRNALGLANISGDIQNTVIGTLLVLSVLGPNIAQRIQGALSRRRLAARSTQSKTG
ncbi:MAG TPA: ABC transporter permease [Ktedonobacteraceae bacterium]|jgi:rhamnose transport system permease protein|nr:ABC transporter permease [Ktedonobacteraceae bacterium]